MDNVDDDEKNILALQIIRDKNRFRIFDDDVESHSSGREKYQDLDMERL